MSLMALSFTLVFIAITMLLSIWQKLGLEKDIAIGTIRSAIQLLAVGYVLHFVFRSNEPVFMAGIIILMIGVASWNAAGRGKGLNGIGCRIAAAIVATECMTMGIMLLFGIIKATPQYIIPVSGMIIGNAMIVCGLFLSHMKRETESSRGEIETLLALGAADRQAIHEVLKRSVKFSMIPTIDSLKTVGLVQLPGMMTGMIVAGANPVDAVRYQILILFAITASAGITSIMLSMLSYQLWFSNDSGLKRVERE